MAGKIQRGSEESVSPGSRDLVTGFCCTPGRRPFISPSGAVDWLGAGPRQARVPRFQDYARLKWIVWSQSAKKRADSRRCAASPARSPFLQRTQFASVRQMEAD